MKDPTHFAPNRVYLAANVTIRAVRFYRPTPLFIVSRDLPKREAPFQLYLSCFRQDIGRVFSVALSLRLPLVAVSDCYDFKVLGLSSIRR